MIMASPALTSLIALLIASLLFALRYYRRAIHISPAFRRLTKPVFLPQSRIVDGKLFPLTLSPVDANAGAAARISLAGTFHAEILALVRTHGAVLLRGWDNKAQTAAHFSELMATLELPTTAMACSAGPRFAVAANVFTANEAPPEERIPFHHEMAQCDAPPSVVAFFCEVAAPHGGACATHAMPMPCPCHAHAMPMPCPCHAHAMPMPCTSLLRCDAPSPLAPCGGLLAQAPPRRRGASQGGGRQVYAAHTPRSHLAAPRVPRLMSA
jgi:hypothetical protein